MFCFTATTATTTSRKILSPPVLRSPSLSLVKWGTAFVDLDNDGWLDLILVNGHVYPQVDSLPSGAGYRQPKVLELNQKNGTFCDASDKAGKALKELRVSRGLAVGDLFNDGNMDVVIEDLDGGPMLLRKTGVLFPDAATGSALNSMAPRATALRSMLA